MTVRPFNDVDLHAYVDDQIGPDRRASIDAYLRVAPGDAARVAAWRRQNEALRTVFADSAGEPVPLWLTVGQIASNRDRPIPLVKTPELRLRRDAGRVRRSGHSAWPVQPTWSLAGVAFVCGLALSSAATYGPVWLDWIRPAVKSQSMRSFLQRAQEAHETYGIDPYHAVDVADSPPGSLRNWLERRVSFAVVVPDLREQGWTLQGGRLAPNAPGPGALLVYSSAGGDRLSLFSGRIAGGNGEGETPSQTADGVFGWSEGQVAFALATTRPAPWLERNGPLLRAAVQSGEPDEAEAR